jgi:hypothetical protein
MISKDAWDEVWQEVDAFKSRVEKIIFSDYQESPYNDMVYDLDHWRETEFGDSQWMNSLNKPDSGETKRHWADTMPVTFRGRGAAKAKKKYECALSFENVPIDFDEIFEKMFKDNHSHVVI